MPRAVAYDADLRMSTIRIARDLFGTWTIMTLPPGVFDALASLQSLYVALSGTEKGDS